MTFRVGQEVVCIEAGPWFGIFGVDAKMHPQKGDVLVVSAIETATMFDGTVLGFEEYGFNRYDASVFRPIVKTDISIFTAMLAPAPKQTVKA